jgi:hypothetical protein
MFLRTVFATSILFVTCVGQQLPSFASTTIPTPVLSPAGHMPVEITLVQGTVAANNTVTYRVLLEGAPTEDQSVTIGCTQSGVYSSIPSTVTVAAGNDSVSFNATFASSLPSSWSTTATSMGKTVWLPYTVNPGVRK